MIKEIKLLRKKYNEILKKSEYISIQEVITDLYRLEMEARIKRIPKNKR